MLTPGLVSISFRNLTVSEIIELCRINELPAIEWGGDVHVPHGDIEIATQVGSATQAAGLTVAAYGSYYRCDAEADQLDFNAVLDSARALGAPVIRVWAGTTGSAVASAAKREAITADLRRIGELAAEQNIEIGIEYHANTLTDDPDSALALIESIDHPNVKLYWQSSNGKSADYSLAVLQKLLPYVSHLHAFHWEFSGDSFDRRPLSEGQADWQKYLSVVATSPRPDRAIMLEFVRDDSTEQLAMDAKTLHAFLKNAD
ncbi:MAG: sugar phosphate isomerase/epimerase [Opitutaceae bacterium]|jgi:3-dehydroshikimate dehydratase|nr:sugar phosphate isomerase/epimerase [Opitutaceae bacterium]